MVGRFLITTADESTWKFDRPVIFLGEWCRIYDRKHVWQEMDAIVAAPYGLEISNKNSDYLEARALEDKLFPLLCNVLNQYHAVAYGERFWRIVLGHWFRRYVDVMLNRIKTLEQCLLSHQITGTAVYANNHDALATPDSYSAIWAFVDDRWNNALNSRILDLLDAEICPIEIIEDYASTAFCYKAITTAPSLKRSLLKWGYQSVCKLGSCFARKKEDAFIINTYLPLAEELKLRLALGQNPLPPISPKLEISEKNNQELRKSLANQMTSRSGDNLKDIMSVMLFELLPVCYLEGFSSLNKLIKEQPWPKKPKFIFTSNSFDTDEVFKLWTATKVESGSKYYIGQHGSNYGTYRYMHPTIDEVIADRFLTWGWTDGMLQHSPAFIFKTAGQKVKQYNPQGGIILIELPVLGHISTWDSHFEFANYFKDQRVFISNLSIKPKQQLTVRLHAIYKYLSWKEDVRWQAFDPKLKIDTGSVAIGNLIAQSRLVVHSYDSTGILETLSQNIPTLAFWQNGFDHLRESAQPYYQLLVDAGIVHFTPESVAQKVNEIWDDVAGWWEQSKVQEARKIFCARYARVSQNPVRELKQILLS